MNHTFRDDALNVLECFFFLLQSFCVVLLQNPNWVRSYFTFFSFPDELVSNLNNFSPAYFSTHLFNFSPLARGTRFLFFPAPLAATDNATTLICVFAPPTTIALRFFVVVVLRIYSGSRPSERSYTMHTSIPLQQEGRAPTTSKCCSCKFLRNNFLGQR